MNKKEKYSNEIKYMYIVTILIIIGFGIMIALMTSQQENKIVYVAVPTAILGCGSLLLHLIFTKLKAQSEYNSSQNFSNLEHLKLPKFKLNKKTNRLYQIYNYRILDKKSLNKSTYSSIATTIKMIPNKGWITTLYYIEDVVFVNCQNNRRSWWGVCRSFEEKHPIWGLHHEFEKHYLNNLENAYKTRTLHDTSIIGANDSQWDPEVGYRF